MRITSALIAITGSLLATAASAQVPQCTVPNTLVNGQVADATDVMENFNAVANCVDDARTEARTESVTHEGTPATGEIAVFTSPTGITGGDLTGDVTTSGSTATQLAPSGVAPGTYFNSTVTVDAKGRVTSAESGPLGSGEWTTLLYQPTYTLPAGTVTVINLTAANEVTVAARQIAKDLSGGHRQLAAVGREERRDAGIGRNHAAIATPVTSAQCVNAWVQAERTVAALAIGGREKTLAI